MVKVLCGGANETTLLLQQKLDFVFFTGGGKIGKLIMQQCSKNLVPVCLELGGKNPVIIDDDCDLDTSMKRIVCGRFDTNGGQVCVAPEYIFISRSSVPECIACIKKHLLSFYSSVNMKSQMGTETYNTIVNDNHFNRLNIIRDSYLNDEQLVDKIVIGNADDMKELFGECNADTRYVPPMVLSNVDFESDPIMQSEVFGPILSIIPMDGTSDQWRDEAIACIQSRDKPLVCYVFSKNDSFIRYCNIRIAAGAVVGNDVVQYLGLHDVPFGGIGQSGCGRYCGRYTFLTFSHEKPLVIRAHGREFFNKDRYPIAGKDRSAKLKKYRKTLEKFYPKKNSNVKKLGKSAIFIVIISICAIAYRRYKNK